MTPAQYGAAADKVYGLAWLLHATGPAPDIEKEARRLLLEAARRLRMLAGEPGQEVGQ